MEQTAQRFSWAVFICAFVTEKQRYREETKINNRLSYSVYILRASVSPWLMLFLPTSNRWLKRNSTKQQAKQSAPRSAKSKQRRTLKSSSPSADRGADCFACCF